MLSICEYLQNPRLASGFNARKPFVKGRLFSESRNYYEFKIFVTRYRLLGRAVRPGCHFDAERLRFPILDIDPLNPYQIFLCHGKVRHRCGVIAGTARMIYVLLFIAPAPRRWDACMRIMKANRSSE